MADQKLTQITSTQTIIDTDLWATVQDMATTPVTKAKSGTTIKAWLLRFPDGTMHNGRLLPSVAANNLTLALKTYAGANPSATDPVYIVIGGVVRTITAALSVTKNAATNWCNAGSAELATKEQDYFAYIGYNATDGVVIGFSRIPYATLYSHFSTTTTNEKYCAISTITTAAAGDNYVNIGRFAATLSAGAGYTWTIPTYTNDNLKQVPTFETRVLSWVPQWTNVTVTGATVLYWYQRINRRVLGSVSFIYGAGSAVGTGPTHTMPFSRSASYGATLAQPTWPARLFDASAAPAFAGLAVLSATSTVTYLAQDSSGATVKQLGITATVPMTWTTSDQIAMDFDYLAD